MPVLKDLTCSIELFEGKRTLLEHGTTYGDGLVETFVAVPHKPQPFSVRLRSDRFIAPGVAMYIFIDGVYQCNRNRQDLKLMKGSDNRSVVDFRVRQKEEKQKDGSMIARKWRFEKMNMSADGVTDTTSSNVLGNIGCIEVIVLRCAGTRSAKSALAMNVDGAGDYGYTDGRSHGHSSGHTAFDDRSLHLTNFCHRPPPPVPSGSYVHSSHHSQPPSAYSSHPESAAPSNAFWYGSGPVPTVPNAPEQGLPPTIPYSTATQHIPGVDPTRLDDLLTKAVQRGVEATKQEENSANTASNLKIDTDNASQIPGAWPSDSESTWQKSDDASNKKNTRSRRRSVAWDDDNKWNSNAKGDKWETKVDTPIDSWDTDESWSTKKPSNEAAQTRGHKGIGVEERRPRSTHDDRSSRHDRSRGHHSRTRSTVQYSKSRRHRSCESCSSTDEAQGRSRVRSRTRSKSLSSSSASSDNTVQPHHSMSQFHRPKHRSRSHHSSRRSKSQQSHSKKSSSHRHRGLDEQPRSIYDAPAFPAAQPMSSAIPQAVIGEPISLGQYTYPNTHQAPTVMTGTVPPPPYVVQLPHMTEHQIEASSSWDANKPENTASVRSSSWKSTTKSKKEKDSWGATGNTDTWTGDTSDDWGSTKEKDNGWSSTCAATESWDTKPSKVVSKEVQWTNSTKSPSSKDSPKETKPLSSRRHTTKSLANYRKHSSKPTQIHSMVPSHISTPANNFPQPHWNFPPSAPTQHTTTIPYQTASSSHVSPFAPEPLHTISAKTASETGLSHQVRAGEGSVYGHAISRPEYLDTLERPYAVFRFKYRDRDVLRGMDFGKDAEKERDYGEGGKSEKVSEKYASRDDGNPATVFTKEWIEKQSAGAVGEKEVQRVDKERRKRRSTKSKKDVEDSWDKSGWGA